MAATESTVLLIDDDADVRDAVGRLLRSAGWKIRTFASGGEFLADKRLDGTGCIVLDINMPDMTGPQLHDWMHLHGISWPVIYLSGNCSVQNSVQAMKQGAVDVLEKPADAEVLLHAVTAAVARHSQACLQRNAEDEVRHRLASLSPRERVVLDQVMLGRLNKLIADELGISLKTVKVHRGRAMAKMQVRSVAEVVHLCNQLRHLD